MRKLILILLLAAVLLLAGVVFGEGSYKPFKRLTADELVSVRVNIGQTQGAETRDAQALSRTADALRTVSVLFTCGAGEEALAELEVLFKSGESAVLTLYPEALTLDGKTYILSPEDSAALLSRIRGIE